MKLGSTSLLFVSLGFGLSQAIAQKAPDLTRLLDASSTLNDLQEIRWTASGEMFDPGQTIVAGSRSRHTFRNKGARPFSDPRTSPD